MQIRTECPTCKNIYELDSQYEGFEVECEGCHKIFTVARLKPKHAEIPKKRPPALSPELNAIMSRDKDKFTDRELWTTTHHTWISIFLIVTTIVKIVFSVIFLFGLKHFEIGDFIDLFKADKFVDVIWLISLFLFVCVHKGARHIYKDVSRR